MANRDIPWLLLEFVKVVVTICLKAACIAVYITSSVSYAVNKFFPTS